MENMSSMRTEMRFEQNHIQITNRKTEREEMNKYALGNTDMTLRALWVRMEKCKPTSKWISSKP